MKPFTFSLMLLLQRIDESLRLERQKTARDQLALTRLRHKKQAVAARLGRSLVPAGR